MRTRFTETQLADPDVQASEKILRTCVHCGFCTATCPTYVLLGDELDGPRGRIALIQHMLESGAPPPPETVKHLDRCLSCLSCMTTCPSGVNYMHLIDHARAYVEDAYRRPWADRTLRSLLSAVMTRPWLFRLAAGLAGSFRWAAALAPGRLREVAKIAPRRLPRPEPTDRPGVFPAVGPQRMRVALMSGCVQPALAPEINAAAVRLLTRHGAEVVVSGPGCCGALPHHLGRRTHAHALARARIAAWSGEIASEGLDAIVVTTSGCGTTVKDYGFMFRDDPEWAERAAAVAKRAADITEVVTRLGLSAPKSPSNLRVAYHSACSMQHGQRLRHEPTQLLAAAGFQVLEPREAHICCGSAGTYNLLQPEIASRLGARKRANLEALEPDVIAAGNIGCMTQIGSGLAIPIAHTVELLDWATGGPKPSSLRGLQARSGTETR
jgi:glycolate oxidase iron-sulfur subunit